MANEKEADPVVAVAMFGAIGVVIMLVSGGSGFWFYAAAALTAFAALAGMSFNAIGGGAGLIAVGVAVVYFGFLKPETELERLQRQSNEASMAARIASGLSPEVHKNCENTDNAKISAFVMSQPFVERSLKSPSTADFPRMTANGVYVSRIRECVFSVTGYVDAQNGFGAVLRTPYTIEIEYNPEDDNFSGRNLSM